MFRRWGNSPQAIGSMGMEVRYQVTGMDCSSCAIKIEDAVTQLPGVSAVEVNYKTQVLQVSLENDGGRAAVEEAVRSLGYSVEPATN